MNILVTGAKGFVGKNLCAALYNIKDGKDRTRPGLKIDEIFEYDLDSDSALLDEYCQKADFVFNLAGVNRPKEQSEFMKGNFGFASTLLDTLKKHGNHCPVMLASSQQASLTGRFGNSEYGRSKKAGEDLFLDYEKGYFLNSEKIRKNEKNENKGLRPRVLIYRFPNLFGKWCRPNYNSAVATFCYNIAHDLPIQVNDPSVELELLYIDDLVNEMLDALEGKEHRCEFNGLEVVLTTDDTDLSDKGRFCHVPTTHHVTLGEIVELLHLFAKNTPSPFGEGWGEAPVMPEIPSGSFEKKLYSTYLSYLPEEKIAFPLKMNVDERGSFTELLKTAKCGQFSVNISKPGITKGQHWHHTKWEFFIVVSGHGLIQMRNMNPSPIGEGKGEVLEFEVSGDKIEAVHMLPGYTHNIINLSDTEDLVTLMWANEPFDPQHPDTFYETV